MKEFHLYLPFILRMSFKECVSFDDVHQYVEVQMHKNVTLNCHISLEKWVAIIHSIDPSFTLSEIIFSAL